MDWIIERVNVWAAGVNDEPGGLAGVLAALRVAGADLHFIISRRDPTQPGAGVVFLTPLRGDAEIAAAAGLGFSLTSSVASLHVEGKDRPGVAAEIAGMLAEAQINLRGFSAAVIGSMFSIYIGFDSAGDADRALELLKSA